MFFCESSKRLLSASCIRSSTSTVWSKAFVSMTEAKEMSWRAKNFCWRILAWYSIWADDAT